MVGGCGVRWQRKERLILKTLGRGQDRSGRVRSGEVKAGLGRAEQGRAGRSKLPFLGQSLSMAFAMFPRPRGTARDHDGDDHGRLPDGRDSYWVG